MLVIGRMNLLIYYKSIMGPMRFFVPGAHIMLKPALKVCHYAIDYIQLKPNILFYFKLLLYIYIYIDNNYQV